MYSFRIGFPKSRIYSSSIGGCCCGNTKRAMGVHRTHNTERRSEEAYRSPDTGFALGLRRPHLGSANRCSLEGHAERVPPLPNLPSLVCQMGGGRYSKRDSLGDGKGFERPRGSGSFRVSDRCHLRGGKKRGLYIGPTRRGKGTKVMAIADRNGLPISIHIESASPHESKLVEKTLDRRFVRERIGRLIGDKAYDSDKLDARLLKRGTRMIAPHIRGRIRPTQDGRELRRYKRRWKIERLFSWLHNFRRVVTRWDTRADLYEGFVRLACIMILARNLF